MKFVFVEDDSEKPILALVYAGNGRIIASAYSFFDLDSVYERVWKGVDLARRRGVLLTYTSNDELTGEAEGILRKVRRSLSNEMLRISLVDRLHMDHLTEFERRVYLATLDVPLGEVVSYGELARRIGTSPRAVGQALARNPFSPVIPCHRVVRKDGSLGGFAGTLDSRDKEKMIEFEKEVAREIENQLSMKWAGRDSNP